MTSLRTQYAEITHFDNADGTLRVEAIARRSGVMRYRSDNGDRYELVPPEMIDKRDSEGRPIMGMLAGAPNTNEHPIQVIRYNRDARKAVEVGKVNEEIHIYTDGDGERSVKVRFDVSDPQTIEDIRSGRKTGVSLGYLCNVVREDGEYKGQRYTHRQAMPFQIDHLAIVANPRNPGALITRFDSEDVAVMLAEERPAFEVVRVDACCAACEGGSEDGPESPKPKKKKKVKTDAEDELMTEQIAINFPDSVKYVGTELAQELWADGSIDRIRLDGEDFFASSDLCLVMEHLDMVRFDEAHFDNGQCGRGWVGVKGKCKRKEGQKGVLKKVGAVAAGAAGLAGLYLAVKNRKAIGRAAARGADRASMGFDRASAAASRAADRVNTAADRARPSVEKAARRAGAAAARTADRVSTAVDRAGQKVKQGLNLS